MTKVKTILAEFCSPKDILAINRLGLLKKEERESQPIPWRHRLPNAERRELVKSEMRMSLGHSRSKVSSRDKLKAYETASNPKESKMGMCLYSIHVRGDPYLGSRLNKIHRERCRLEASQQRSKQQFLAMSHSLNHEPLLLVERNPSQVVKTRVMLIQQHGVDPETLLKPSYMRPIQSRSRTPSTLATIDAFAAETKKKQNVWEKAINDRNPPKFRSSARPSVRLNDREMQHLRLGHALHKPRPESMHSAHSSRSIPTQPRNAQLESKSPASKTRKDGKFGTEFITQQYHITALETGGKDPPPVVKKVEYSTNDAGPVSNRQKNLKDEQQRKKVTFASMRSTSSNPDGNELRSSESLEPTCTERRPVSVTPSVSSGTAAWTGRNVSGHNSGRGLMSSHNVPNRTSSDGREKSSETKKREMDFLSSLLDEHP